MYIYFYTHFGKIQYINQKYKNYFQFLNILPYRTCHETVLLYFGTNVINAIVNGRVGFLVGRTRDRSAGTVTPTTSTLIDRHYFRRPKNPRQAREIQKENMVRIIAKNVYLWEECVSLGISKKCETSLKFSFTGIKLEYFDITRETNFFHTLKPILKKLY